MENSKMIEVRCKLCNTELKSHPTQTKCCGCNNMVTVVGDKITALDLSKVVMLNSMKAKQFSSYFTEEELAWQNARANRKVRKMEFEIR
jgi:hypothetical protein